MLDLVQNQYSKCPHKLNYRIKVVKIMSTSLLNGGDLFKCFVAFSEYLNFRLLWTRRASSLLVAVYIKYFVAHSWGEQFGEEEEPRLAANRKNYGTASSIGSWGHSSSCCCLLVPWLAAAARVALGARWCAVARSCSARRLSRWKYSSL